MLLFAYISYSWYNITVTLKQQIVNNKGYIMPINANGMYSKNCIVCGEQFESKKYNALYCKPACLHFKRTGKVLTTYTKVCPVCKTEFKTKKENKIYCKPNCSSPMPSVRARATRLKHLEDSVPDGTIGAIHELVVCADLMRKGFHVFRAQSPACPCDLVCVSGNRMIRIEVKTGHRLDNGRLLYPVTKLDTNAFDVLAVILYDGGITYLNNAFEPTELSR